MLTSQIPHRFKILNGLTNPHSAVIFGRSLLKPVYIAEPLFISAFQGGLESHFGFKLWNVGLIPLL